MMIVVKWLRIMRYHSIRMLRSRQGASKISLGIVFGFFPCWYPTFGIGPVLSIGLTKWAKGSIAGSIFAAALGAVVWPIFFYMNVITGNWIMKLAYLLHIYSGDIAVGGAGWLQVWLRTGLNFTIGAILNSILFTLLGYWIWIWIIQRFRPQLLQMARPRRRCMKQVQSES
ncbi:DUF2062 domain-containing protein [Paenibacillus agilis]|uniref:DUF2062 domain-containing protein n=1 Tax=Paenibacillus agilis TaxID=3020863 RepID=A0A559IKN5_9BACL|nr:DUF2062 domain-containing protein [Paenibacillus agilis]TVX88218.1 DUF2062 domain-containing protein [Paenibacillus agilis]